MFYCEECRADRQWPESIFKSYGRCEICEKSAPCNERSSSFLAEFEERLEKQNQEDEEELPSAGNIPARILLLVIAFMLLLFFIFSCNSSDCNNGIQDGNETGIDCGGDCMACPTMTPTAIETQMSGDWYLYRTVHQSIWDTVYSPMSPDCKIHLSLNEVSPGIYSAYGTIGSCAYTEQFESSWYIDQSNRVNGTMNILLLTGDSLYLEQYSQEVEYHYYR